MVHKEAGMGEAPRSNHQDVLQTLEKTPAVLEALLAGLPEKVLVWKPTAGRWSIQEVLIHLLDVEVNALGLRARRILEEENPLLPDYDQTAPVSGKDPADSGAIKALDDLRQEREKTTAWLRGVREESLSRVGQHAAIGEITLRNHLNQWAFHDLGHIRQVAELTRACLYYPHTGNYHKFYSVNP